MNKGKKYYWLGIILVIGLVAVTRFWKLGSVPVAVSQDEMIYALNAKSVALTGRGITGEWKPLSLTPVGDNFDELTTVMMAPFFWLPISAELAMRIPVVMISIFLPILMGMIAFELKKDKFFALTTGVVTAFNPWIWQFARMGFDPYWGMFFLVWGTWIFIRHSDWRRLGSLPLFFLSFYQYQGYKLVFLPWVALWCGYVIIKNRSKGLRKTKDFKSLLVVFTSAVVLMGYYLLAQLPNQGSVSRLSLMIWPNHQMISQRVNDQRRLTLDSSLNRFLVNDYTIWIKHVFERYISVYDPRRLFFEGQANFSAYSVWNHGVLYVIEGLLLVMGAVALMNKKNRALLGLILGGLLIMPLPALLGETDWYIFRPSLIFPFIFLMIGLGAMELKKHSKLLLKVVGGIYLLSVLNFAYIYFYSYPVISAERHYFTEKVVSEYISRATNLSLVRVITPEDENLFKSLVFYNNILNKDSALGVQSSFLNQVYEVDEVLISKGCVEMNDLESGETLIIRKDASWCIDGDEVIWDQIPDTLTAKLKDRLSFAAVNDSGEVYGIFNDKLCQDVSLGTYLRINSLGQFNFRVMDNNLFCKTWVTDLKPLIGD
jgi:hypothetical protein